MVLAASLIILMTANAKHAEDRILSYIGVIMGLVLMPNEG
jgi:hypothetical protein